MTQITQPITQHITQIRDDDDDDDTIASYLLSLAELLDAGSVLRKRQQSFGTAVDNASRCSQSLSCVSIISSLKVDTVPSPRPHRSAWRPR